MILSFPLGWLLAISYKQEADLRTKGKAYEFFDNTYLLAVDEYCFGKTVAVIYLLF